MLGFLQYMLYCLRVITLLGVPIVSVPFFYFSQLTIHHYSHMVGYAIPQHSSLVSGNYSNNSPEWTARQEAKSMVCSIVS
jgi:hypothetical protein